MFTGCRSTIKTLTVATVGLFCSGLQSATLFEENFDNQSEWTSNSDTTPPGWFAHNGRPNWAPSTGFPDKHESIEILSRNSDKARHNQGKSAVFWRESNGRNFQNDKILAYRVPGGLHELYVEFYIKFSPNWAITGEGSDTSKLFRIYAWDADGTDPPRLFYFFRNGNGGPIFVNNYTQNSTYGQRNFLALRGGPYGENYYMTTPAGFPRSLITGDVSMNFTEDSVGQGVNGTTPQIPDRVNGGLISDNLRQTVRHAQLYGHPQEGRWNKFAYHVKMNSAPGVADGVLTQWLNGVQIFRNANIPWVGPTDLNEDIRWDIVAIGGNDAFSRFPSEQRYEEWYAIDDLRVMDSIPADLGGTSSEGPGDGSPTGQGACLAN